MEPVNDSIWKRPAFALVLLPLLALLFNWPYLMGGFMGDDIIFINLMEQDPLPFSRWHGAWSMSDLACVDTLWWKEWKDSGDTGVFWRPIPSLVFEGSLHLFGRNAFPLHLLSILLHGGVAVGLYLLVRALSGRHGLAFLSGLFFVACEDHSMGVGWISTITDLFCVFFILLAFLSHVQWLKRRNPAALVGALAALILAMGCKETASIAPLGIILLTFFMPTGDQTEGSKLRQRIVRTIKDSLSWLPALAMLVAYLVVYKTMNMGNIGNLLYISPFADPLGFLGHMVIHLPMFWLGTLSPVPLYLPMFVPESEVILAVLGVVVFIAWAAALYTFRHESLAQWAVVLYLIALLPQLCTMASERGLYFPMIPASILLAYAAMTIAPMVRRMVPSPSPRPRWTRITGWWAMTGILAPGILISAALPWSFLPSMDKPERELLTALAHIERQEPEHVLVLNTSGFMLTLYTWDTLNYLSERPVDAWVLSSACGVFSIQKTGDSSFVISTDRVGWLDNMFARILRTNTRLKPGRRYETALFTATLEELTPSRTDVLAVRFDLCHPLDDPGWMFLRWNGKAFEPLNIAGMQAGETFELADTSDIWKAMN